jgi:hypothetical protein
MVPIMVKDTIMYPPFMRTYLKDLPSKRAIIPIDKATQPKPVINPAIMPNETDPPGKKQTAPNVRGSRI